MSAAKHSYALRPAAPAGTSAGREPAALAAGRRYGLALVLGLLGIAAWQAVTFFRDEPTWLLPSPWDVLQALADSPGLIFRHAAVTAQEAIIGLVISVVFGFLLGVAVSWSRLVEQAVYPYVIASQAVPIIAIGPVLVVWLGWGLLPKIVIIVLITFFPITINTVDGLRRVDPEMLTLMRSLGASPWQVFKTVRLPSALPLIFSGAKIAAAVAVIGAVFGEWVGASEGLAFLIKRASAQFLTARVFASVVVLAVMGVLLFSAVAYLERKATPWARRQANDRAGQGR